MFIEINGKIFDKEDYLSSIEVLKLIIGDELEELTSKYGFKDFKHDDLELIFSWSISTKNYLKEL
jgi:hypothetical protein